MTPIEQEWLKKVTEWNDDPNRQHGFLRFVVGTKFHFSEVPFTNHFKIEAVLVANGFELEIDTTSDYLSTTYIITVKAKDKHWWQSPLYANKK